MTTFEKLLQEEEHSARILLLSPTIQDRVLGKHTLERILRLKEAYEKQFPNGFEDWAETHHEVVAEILVEGTSSERIESIIQEKGSGGLYELGIELTEAFETQNKGVVWGSEEGLDYYDTIEDFLSSSL